MHRIHTPVHAAPGTHALIGWIGRTYAGWRRRHEVARTQFTLSALSDATLHDIGLHRSEIESVATHARFAGRF
jgi:uncharacterized protein YjiS (DUF1127 family)